MGIDNIRLEKDITIYPNPNNGLFTLDIVNPDGDNLLLKMKIY